MNGFLPISKEELIQCGIEQLDFVYVIGDAYVDHPSFGHAIISRVLHFPKLNRCETRNQPGNR